MLGLALVLSLGTSAGSDPDYSGSPPPPEQGTPGWNHGGANCGCASGNCGTFNCCETCCVQWYTNPENFGQVTPGDRDACLTFCAQAQFPCSGTTSWFSVLFPWFC